MKFLSIISFAVAVVTVTTALELQPATAPRLIGGTNATIDEFPYFLQIEYNNAFLCGAVVYNEHTAVTSAHCVNNVQASHMVLRSGSDKQGSGGNTHQAIKLIRHPQYDGYDYDVGVIVVNEPFNMSSAISLATSQPPVGGKVTVAGMGKDKDGGNLTNLQYINGSLISQEECQKSYLWILTITDRMACAITEGGLCDYDFGGPLVYNGQLAGVVNFFNPCEKSNFPKIYTNIAELSTWIQDTAADS